MSIVEILNENGLAAIMQIRDNLSSTGTNATSQTSQSLKVEINQVMNKVTMQITARKYFMVVETGRKPTPEKGPSRQMLDNIRQWMNARGLDPSKAWGVAHAINDRGSALWRKGGRKDIVSNVLDDKFTMKIENQILEAMGKQFVENILNDFKNIKDVHIR